MPARGQIRLPDEPRPSENRTAQPGHPKNLPIIEDFEAGAEQVDLPFRSDAGPKSRAGVAREARPQDRPRLPSAVLLLRHTAQTGAGEPVRDQPQMALHTLPGRERSRQIRPDTADSSAMVRSVSHGTGQQVAE